MDSNAECLSPEKILEQYAQIMKKGILGKYYYYDF